MAAENPNSVLFGIPNQILVRGTKGWFDGNPDSSSKAAGWYDGAYPLNAIRSVTSDDQNVWWRSEGKNGHWGDGYTNGSKLVFDAGSGKSTTGMDFWYYTSNSGNPLPESYLGTGRLYLSDPETLPDNGKDFDTFMVDKFVVSGIQPDKDDERNVYYFEKLVPWGLKIDAALEADGTDDYLTYDGTDTDGGFGVDGRFFTTTIQRGGELAESSVDVQVKDSSGELLKTRTVTFAAGE